MELPGRAPFLITSYPCGESILSKLKGITVPVIILADHVGKELVKILEGLESFCCIVKSIDYRRYTLTVKESGMGCCFFWRL